MSEALARQDAFGTAAGIQLKSLESATETTITSSTAPTACPTQSIVTGESRYLPTIAVSPQQQPQAMSTMMIVISCLLGLVLVLQLYILVELRGVKESLRVGSCPASSSSWSRATSTFTSTSSDGDV
jgi:hypothetical protein